MMEPVASVWRVIEQGNPKTYWVAKGSGDETGWKVLAEKCPDRFSIEYCDLVPQSALSDAEARIATLEAENAALAAHACVFLDGSGVTGDEHGNSVCMLSRRLEAAEALLKEQEAKIERLMLFGGRMANACYNIGQKPKPSHMDMVDLLFAQAEWDKAVRAARAIHDKIGERTE